MMSRKPVFLASLLAAIALSTSAYAEEPPATMEDACKRLHKLADIQLEPGQDTVPMKMAACVEKYDALASQCMDQTQVAACISNASDLGEVFDACLGECDPSASQLACKNLEGKAIKLPGITSDSKIPCSKALADEAKLCTIPNEFLECLTGVKDASEIEACVAICVAG